MSERQAWVWWKQPSTGTGGKTASTPPGPEAKEVRIKETTVKIKIFNTGKNIPEESITKIWDKFYKVDKARTREYGGSGVGLSIVKAIMESMQRGYGVENTENGVLFWFELERA